MTTANNPIRAYVRKYLEDNAAGGTSLTPPGATDPVTGWFTTREILDAIIGHLDPTTKTKDVSNVLCILAKRGEIQRIKGAPGSAYYGYHRFLRRPAVQYHTGTVGLAPRHKDPEHRRELYRLYMLKKGHVVGEKRDRVKKMNRATAPHRVRVDMTKAAIAPPPPPKVVFETYEEFLARGGKPEVLPGVNIQPPYVRCALKP